MHGHFRRCNDDLSVYLPHSGLDEEDHFATLEAVRNIMDEGKKLGAVDFFIGGDINIELKLEPGDEDLQGLDGIGWYGIYGLECLGGGEDVIICEKKLWWLQLLRETSIARSQVSGWMLKILGNVIRGVPGVLVSERNNLILCLCSEGSRSWCDANEISGLEALQARVEGAVEVKATTLASRNKNKFMVPEEIREFASLAAQCRDPVKRILRKNAQKARGEFDARNVYTAKNVMMTNQRRGKNKLRELEYRGAEVTARLLFKVRECRSRSTGYFVRAGRCYVANPMAWLTAWWWRC